MYQGPNVHGDIHNYSDLNLAERGTDVLRTGDIAYFDEGAFI